MSLITIQLSNQLDIWSSIWFDCQKCDQINQVSPCPSSVESIKVEMSRINLHVTISAQHLPCYTYMKLYTTPTSLHKHAVTPNGPLKFQTLVPDFGTKGGELPNMAYTGMCCWIRYVPPPPPALNRVYNFKLLCPNQDLNPS